MQPVELTLLYDGSCPLCRWEKRKLGQMDKQGKLAFVDIQAPDFNPALYGTTMEALMARLHGVTADGRILQGVETVIASYRAVGWWWAYVPLRIVPRRLADEGYDWFARRRHGISHRFGRIFGATCDQGKCRRKENQSR